MEGPVSVMLVWLKTTDKGRLGGCYYMLLITAGVFFEDDNVFILFNFFQE